MKLGELIEIKHGYAFSGEHIVEDDNGIVLVTPGNFRIGGGFKEEKCKFFDGEIPADYVLKEGDFIVTMTDLSKTIDTLGYSALVPKSKRIYLHNQRIGLVTFKSDECDRGYIYWLMRTREYQRSIANTSTGATVHHTSPKKIYDYDLEVPPLPIQHRIANILSRYDSLIENYQKQIKLLEEAAQRLYKEWFVDLHFPGHENTNIVDGVPVGWEKKKISDVCTMIGAGSTPSRRNNAYWDDGNIRWVKTKELLDNWIFDTEEYITEEGLNNSSTKMFPVNTILMAIYASPTLGRLGILAQECCCNQAALGLVANEKLISWVWLYLKLFELRDEFNAVARGAGQQNISGVVVKNWEITVPNKKTIEDFAKMAKPYFENAKSLQSQLRLLTEARDRLLPKLMSGEINVES